MVNRGLFYTRERGGVLPFFPISTSLYLSSCGSYYDVAAAPLVVDVECSVFSWQ
jgi:hypothetical protein